MSIGEVLEAMQRNSEASAEGAAEFAEEAAFAITEYAYMVWGNVMLLVGVIIFAILGGLAWNVLEENYMVAIGLGLAFTAVAIIISYGIYEQVVRGFILPLIAIIAFGVLMLYFETSKTGVFSTIIFALIITITVWIWPSFWSAEGLLLVDWEAAGEAIEALGTEGLGGL